MSRPEDPAQGAGKDAAPGEFVVWGHNGRTAMTTWREPAGVVHTRAGLALPGGGKLWEWTVPKAPVRTLDCGCYDPYDQPPSSVAQGGNRERCAEDTPLDTLVFDQVAGDGVWSAMTDLPDDAGADPGMFEGTIARTFVPLGSVGPYLFVARKDAVYVCGTPKPKDVWTSAVLDLDAQKPTTIFSPAELARIEAEEKVEAAQALCVAPDCFQPKPEAVTLARVRPAFAPDGKLGLKLLFTGEATLAAGDGVWSTGTRSVELDAKALPAALQPYADAPAAVTDHWKVGEVPAAAGWSPIGDELRNQFGG